MRDAKEADSGPGRSLRISERASNPDASPFGLVLRHNGDSDCPPFAGWRYQPMYFDPGVSFLVAENSKRLGEPLCICMPNNSPSGSPQSRSEAPFIEVTELRLHVPVDEPSSVLEAVARVVEVLGDVQLIQFAVLEEEPPCPVDDHGRVIHPVPGLLN